MSVPGKGSPNRKNMTIDSGSGREEPCHAVANSPFYHLPSELRLNILRLAFGDRTLHLDIFDSNHLADNITTYQYIPCGERKWRGSVCHRKAKGLSQDDCRDSFAVANIGATGWLRSCRLGYLESTHVLYTTNTFHISCANLLDENNLILLPNQISRIRALEVPGAYQFLVGYLSPDGPWDPPRSDLGETLLGNIRDYFTSLRRLELSLAYELVSPPSPARPECGLDFLDQAIGLVDRVLCRARDIHVEVAIPMVLFDTLKSLMQAGGAPHYSVIGESEYWRKGEGSSGLVVVPA